MTSAQADSLGAFTFDEVVRGRVMLVARHDSVDGVERISPPLAIQDDDTNPCTLVVEPAGSIFISSISPIVETLAASGEWLPALAAGSGAFDCEYRSVAPGQFRVRSRMGSDEPVTSSWLFAGETVDVLAPRQERVSRRVEGRVVRWDGSPIESADVWGRDGVWEVLDSTTRPDGAFVISPPQRALILHIDGGGPEPVVVPLPPGAGTLDLGDIRIPDAP